MNSQLFAILVLLASAYVVQSVPAVDVAEESNTKEYEVKDGDTLESLANANGIDANILAEKNGLSADTILSPGIKINLPIDGQARWRSRMNTGARLVNSAWQIHDMIGGG